MFQNIFDEIYFLQINFEKNNFVENILKHQNH